MILVTHGVGGATAAAFLSQNPITAFFIGFVSHFLLDTIPHWHYPIHSVSKNGEDKMQRVVHKDSRLISDFFRTGIDMGLGVFLSFFFSVIDPKISLEIIFWGAIGGVVPDFLQLVYYLFPKEPLRSLQKFHIWIHARKSLDHLPILGIGSQVFLILLCFGLVFLGTK